MRSFFYAFSTFTCRCIFILMALYLSSCNEEPDEPIVPQTKTGTDLYYYSKRAGINNIFKSNLDGEESVIIADQNHHDWWIRVSPLKDKILWYKSPTNVPTNKEYNNYEEAELWQADIDGKNPKKLIDLKDYNWQAQGVVDWSPDAKKLVMAVIDSSGFWQIYTTDAEGMNPQKISRRNSLFADPSWSPDGTQIVYTAYPVNYMGNPLNFFNLEIHVMNADGSDERRLTNDTLRDHDPYWSPDGLHIAFESQWNILHCFIGKWAIRKYNFHSQQTVELVKDDNANGLPRWTKNSEEIYYSKTTCGEFTRLYRMNDQGANQQIILESTTHPFYDCDVVEY